MPEELQSTTPETSAPESLRDRLEGAFSEAESPGEGQPPAATATADARARDEAGRFAKQEAQRKEGQGAGKPAQGQQQDPAATDPAAQPQRPSTWKKEHWERFDKLEPQLREYILQRETEYKAGLAAYNAEVKAAKTLREAIEPFLPELQRHNVDPAVWIRNLGNAHQTLALGSPQAKLQIFARLAQDYGVPLQYLVPNAQGQVAQMDPTVQYLAQNLQGLQQQWQQFQTQRQQQEQASIQESIREFAADTKEHPHFETVRESMAALLSSGMAQNLQQAYDKAIWMAPEVRTAVLAAQQQQEQTARVEQARSAASKARAQAVSPRSASPGAAAVKPDGRKGLRESLEASFGELSGRV